MHRILLVFLVACGSPQETSTPPAAPVTPAVKPAPAAETWVIVGSMLNPSDPSSPATDVDVAFAAAHIPYEAYGSLGFTIAVKETDAAHARDILRTIPNVGVVE